MASLSNYFKNNPEAEQKLRKVAQWNNSTLEKSLEIAIRDLYSFEENRHVNNLRKVEYHLTVDEYREKLAFAKKMKYDNVTHLDLGAYTFFKWCFDLMDQLKSSVMGVTDLAEGGTYSYITEDTKDYFDPDNLSDNVTIRSVDDQTIQ
jgi:hypothetical protein